MKKLFIYLVVADLILTSIAFLMPYTWDYFYSIKEIQLLQISGYNSTLNSTGIFSYIFPAVGLIASIGLLQFKKWARVLFIAIVFATIIMGPFWGISVSPSLDNTIGYIISLLDGAIISISLLTSVGSSFE